MLLDGKFRKMQCKICENLKMKATTCCGLDITKNISIPITTVQLFN